MHFCICRGNDLITYCSISLWITWIHSWIHCFKPSVFGKTCSICLAFVIDQMAVFWYCQIRQAGRPGDVCKMRNESSWEHCPASWHGSLFCVSSCSKHHCAWWQWTWLHQSADKLVFKFQVPSSVPGTPGPPAHLILQCQTTSFGAMSKARYMKHTLPKLMT